MKPAEIRSLSTKELQEKIIAETKRLDRLKVDHAISPLQNTAQIRILRKDIARMKTILTEKMSESK